MSASPGDEEKPVVADNDGLRLSLEELLRQYRPILVRRAQQGLGERLQKRVDASDIVQQTCLLAADRIDQFRGESRDEFLAWLVQIQERALINAFRQHQQAQRRTIDRETPGSGAVNFAAEELTSPSQGAVKRERRQLIHEAIQSLPPGQREVIELRFVRGLSLQQIAERIDKSESATAGLLKRGLAKLRVTLGNDSLFRL